MYAWLMRPLRLLCSSQSGQSLVIMSVVMTAVLGMAAVSIDAASWDVKHHQDQVVADAAALAAANCLANPNTGPNSTTVPQCTSTTDTTDATQVAVTYARQNGLNITTSNVNVTGSQVKVTANSSSPSYFARIAGVRSASESASATAGFTGGTASTTCTAAQQSAGNCYAIYTQDPNCGTSDGWVTGSASVTITGAIHTQGTMNFGSGGGTYTFTGPATYSSGNCTVTVPQNSTMKGSTPTAGDNQTSTYWPINYATDFPACSATGTYQCTGPDGTPSYCTISSSSGSISLNWSNTLGGVYCAYGTGTPSTPSSWNGAITLNSNSNGTSSAPASVTFIAGYVNATSESNYLQPAMDGCLMYVLDSNSQAGSANSNYAVSLSNGSMYLSGTIFAPNGTIYLNGVSLTTGFLEGYSVNSSNLTFTGNGPLATSGGSSSSSSGTDSLTQ